jgi:hypothetical protein
MGHPARAPALRRGPAFDPGGPVIEVSVSDLVVVGDAALIRMPLGRCSHEVRDARCLNRFVRHMRLTCGRQIIDLVTPPGRGAIAPRAANLPEIDPSPNATLIGGPLVGEIDPSPKAILIGGPLVGEIDPSPKAILIGGPLVGEIESATAVIEPVLLPVLDGWLISGRRLVGHTLRELALLSRLASTSFAIAIGERAADLATQMTWERGSPQRSSALTDIRDLLVPFEEQAAVSERANLALMAALARVGRAA